MKYHIVRKPDKYDHNLLFTEDTERDRYIGFISKKERNGKRMISIVHCPICERENWVTAVASGMCAWCGWEIDKNAVLKLGAEDAKS